MQNSVSHFQAQIRAGLQPRPYIEPELNPGYRFTITAFKEHLETIKGNEDETTALLHQKPNIITERFKSKYCGEYVSSQSDVRKSQNFDQSKLSTNQLIFRRTLTIVGLVAVVMLGVFFRLRFSGPESWTDMCIPYNNTTGLNDLGNLSLPICNVTMKM